MEHQNSKREIEHQGRVISVDADKITVSIVSQSACISCISKSNCSVGDIEDKIITVQSAFYHKYAVNDIVTVVLDRSMGAKAVLLGYFFPFLILLFTVIVLTFLNYSEGFAGVMAILMLVPYYTLLYFTRKKQEHTFNFRIK
jgi:sigma-E factor negative regulatory protein RseC